MKKSAPDSITFVISVTDIAPGMVPGFSKNSDHASITAFAVAASRTVPTSLHLPSRISFDSSFITSIACYLNSLIQLAFTASAIFCACSGLAALTTVNTPQFIIL
ncbi:MAG: hypothetical protein L5655_04875 [Thermosediminibacteraceae bacterium]|nr:hypothetical protein [Thermosediminibacteraceae bacterium]